MTVLAASIAGLRVTKLVIRVPQRGPWVADADIDVAAELAGKVAVTVGDLVMHGTVLPQYSGTFTGKACARVVAGAASWGKLIPARRYHNDARIRTSIVVGDIVREAGETITPLEQGIPVLEGVPDRLGIDYVREAAPASRALRQAIGNATWFVDYDGNTRVQARAEADATVPFEVLDYDPRTRIATVVTDHPEGIGVGTVLRSKRLPYSVTVRELTITVQGGAIRLLCRATSTQDQRVIAGLRALVRETFPTYAFMCPRRYRVVDRAGDRLDLQIVKKTTGLPDVLPIAMWPGLAGGWTKLEKGTEVVVQFIDGEQPIVTHYAPKGAVGFVPMEAELDASSRVMIGRTASETLLGAGTGTVVCEGDTITLSDGSTGVVTINAGHGVIPAKSKVKA